MDQGRARVALGAALILLAGCAAGGGAAGGGRQDLAPGSHIGAPLPAIQVDTLAGKHIDLAAYRGRVLLLDVWASWCAPCKQELPMLDAMAGRLKARGIDIVAVSVDQQRENVDKFLHGHSRRWSLTIAHDPAGVIAERLQPDKMPTSYIVDRAGVVRYVNEGFIPEDAQSIEHRLLEVAGQ
jgi:thiol-disulfide isomerase/thioredoxin